MPIRPIRPVWADLDGEKVGILKNWRHNPLSTAQRIALGGVLTVDHISLFVFDTDLTQGFYWEGSNWSAGITGPGIPAGGLAGEVLKKNSATDYDVSWQPDNAGIDEDFVIAMAISL